MYYKIARPDGKARMAEINACFTVRTNKRRTTFVVEWRVNILEVSRVEGLLASVMT